MLALFSTLVRGHNSRGVRALKLKFFVTWCYQTWRCPSLWNNPIQVVTAWNHAALGRWPWDKTVYVPFVQSANGAKPQPANASPEERQHKEP